MKAYNVAQLLAGRGWSPFGRRLMALFLCGSALLTSPKCVNAQQLYISGFGGPSAIGVCNASLDGAFSGNFIRLSIGNRIPLVIMGNTLFAGEGNTVVSYN